MMCLVCIKYNLISFDLKIAEGKWTSDVKGTTGSSVHQVNECMQHTQAGPRSNINLHGDVAHLILIITLSTLHSTDAESPHLI